MKDEILTELWSIKDQIATEVNGSTKTLFARLKQIQEKSDHPVVNRTQKRKKQPA